MIDTPGKIRTDIESSARDKHKSQESIVSISTIIDIVLADGPDGITTH